MHRVLAGVLFMIEMKIAQTQVHERRDHENVV
jgi:hypothetical protein